MQRIGICPAVLALELEAEYLITAEWDYFQRLLLLLRSDASLKTDQCRRWTGRQVSALAAVAAFVVGVLLLGFGWQLLLLTIPLSVVSMAISCWPSGEGEAETDAEATDFVRLTPYSSASEMLAVHRTVPNFRKRRYPVAMASCRIRGPVGNALLLLHTGAMWFVFSPVVLLFQALPQDRSTTRIVPA